MGHQQVALHHHRRPWAPRLHPEHDHWCIAVGRGAHHGPRRWQLHHRDRQGQTRQHARLINLLGVKQICIGVNKMDCDIAGYKQARYDEIANEMKNMLIKVGWKKDFIEKNAPILPISGWCGDNLLKKSTNMPWWNGMDCTVPNHETMKLEILFEVLDLFCRVPERPIAAPMRMPISGIYKIKGVGDVLAGRVE